MPSPDDLGEGLLARLRELFDAVETALQGVAERGGEPAEHDLILRTVYEQIRPALVAEAEQARLSSTATWHLYHLAVVLLEQAGIPDHGTGSGVYRPLNSAIKRLSEYLASAPPGPPYEPPKWLEDWVGRLAHELSDDLAQSLPTPLSNALAQSLPTPLSSALAQSLPTPLSSALAQSLPTPLSSALAQSLPDPLAAPLSADLIQSLPGPVAQAVVAELEAVQDKTSADIAALTDLTETRLDQTIKSPADGIQFLENVLAALEAVLADIHTIPADLVQPVTNAVLAVFNFAAPAATITDLNRMNELKQQVAGIFKPTAPAVPVAAGGIQLCRPAEHPRRSPADRPGIPPPWPQP
jgi:hypothetical protein